MYHLKSSQLDGPVDDEQEGGDGPTGENYLAGFFEPGVAPHAAVQAVDLVADQGHDYHDEEEEGEVPAVRRWGDVAPEEHLRSAVAGQDADGVQHHEEDLCPHTAGGTGIRLREAVGKPGRLPARGCGELRLAGIGRGFFHRVARPPPEIGTSPIAPKRRPPSTSSWAPT